MPQRPMPQPNVQIWDGPPEVFQYHDDGVHNPWHRGSHVFAPPHVRRRSESPDPEVDEASRRESARLANLQRDVQREQNRRAQQAREHAEYRARVSFEDELRALEMEMDTGVRVNPGIVAASRALAGMSGGERDDDASDGTELCDSD